LTSALDGCEWSALRSNRFTHSQRAPGTHLIGGWVGPCMYVKNPTSFLLAVKLNSFPFLPGAFLLGHIPGMTVWNTIT